MATLYVWESPQATLDMYDRVNASIERPPEGSLCHFACERDGGGLLVIEVWENEEAQDRWNNVVQEKIKAAGGPGRPEPRKYRVHNMRLRDEETASR
jgi:hypothetical protein